MSDSPDLQPLSFPQGSPASPGQASLPGRAVDDLRFIRATMERAAAFSAIPGWGGVLMGLVAVAAAPLAGRAGTPTEWLGVWLAAAGFAAVIGAVDILRKARYHRASLLRGPGWRFATALLPSFGAAACLTFTFAGLGLHDHLPGMWLLLYGAAALAAGPYTIRQVRVMGATFMLLGVIALATQQLLQAPASRVGADLWMVFGFGGLHVGFGAWIARATETAGDSHG